MSDSGHTWSHRPPSEWTALEHMSRLRMYVSWARHPTVRKNEVMVPVAELAAIADILNDLLQPAKAPDPLTQVEEPPMGKSPSYLALWTALRMILNEPYGCPLCDSGKLRNHEKSHWDSCGFNYAISLIGSVDAAQYARNKKQGEPQLAGSPSSIEVADPPVLEWQPMETIHTRGADNVPILVQTDSGCVHRVSWYPFEGWKTPDGRVFAPYQLVNWMPLQVHQPISPSSTWFVERKHPEAIATLQISGPYKDEAAASETLDRWQTERPDLHPVKWQAPVKG